MSARLGRDCQLRSHSGLKAEKLAAASTRMCSHDAILGARVGSPRAVRPDRSHESLE